MRLSYPKSAWRAAYALQRWAHADEDALRIVLHAFGTRGDVHPMIALALEAQCRGHDVLVCAPPDFAHDAERRSVPFAPIGGRSAELLEQRNDLAMQAEQARRQVAELCEAAQGADLVVGAGIPLAGPSAAEAAGCSYRYLAYEPECVASDDHVAPLFPVKTMPRTGRLVVNALFNAAWKLLYDRPLNEARVAAGLPKRRGVSAEPFAGDPPMVLACDPLLGPMPTEPHLPVVQTGDIRLPPLHGLSPALSAFLDTNGPAIYLGFGSMSADVVAPPLALARTLHSATGLPVVLNASLPGEEALPDWCAIAVDEPHELLFPRCAVAVHHGGAGTTTASARAGIPQVIVPHFADQFFWALRVRALGIGERVSSRARDPRVLANVTEGIVRNAVTTTRAQEVAASMGESRGTARTLDALLASGSVA